MSLSFRNVVLCLGGALLFASAISNYFLFGVVEEQAIKNGELEAQLFDVTDKNNSLNQTVINLQEERKADQLASDKLALEKLQHKKQEQKVIKVIKEVIKNEACVDVPIPNTNKWVYYNEGGN